MVLTAPFYDGYNSRYCKNEMVIIKYVFGEYLKNQTKYDILPLAKMITKTWHA